MDRKMTKLMATCMAFTMTVGVAGCGNSDTGNQADTFKQQEENEKIETT